MSEKTQHELALELGQLGAQLDKVLGEVRPVDQVADITFHIDVHSTISLVTAEGDFLSDRWVSEEWLNA
jgi:hypothetical protein